MTLDQVPAGAHVFVDSNILVYHFQPHPGFGPMCHASSKHQATGHRGLPLPIFSASWLTV